MIRKKYDFNDAVMAHQAVCNRMTLASNSQLLEEYFSVCREHADTPQARTTHQRFVQQVEAMRALMTTQRPLAAGVLALKGGQPQAQQQYARTQFSIIPPEWSREHYKKLVYQWNVASKELVLTSTEAIVAWLLSNVKFEKYDQLVRISDATCYNQYDGVVYQKWTSAKDAKNFVNALHLIVNAPLSRFVTPFAFFVEILGVSIVAMSVAPLERPWTTWRSTPLCSFHVDALCASARLFFHAFSRSGSAGAGPQRNNTGADDDDDGAQQDRDDEARALAARQAHAAAGPSTANASINFAEVSTMPFVVSIGSDSRWYVVDARSLANRQPFSRQTSLSLRVPRRELLFSPSGVLSTPYSPNEFTLRFKIKIVAEQLLSDSSFSVAAGGAAAGTAGGISAAAPSGAAAAAPLVSSVMHQHGVRFGPYVYALYLFLSEQERQFKAGVSAANRRNALTPAAQAKLLRFEQVKRTIVSELFARIVKQLIREEVLHVEQGKGFLSGVLDAVTDALDDDGQTEQLIAKLNSPLLSAMNLVLSSVFNAEGAASATANNGASIAQRGGAQPPPPSGFPMPDFSIPSLRPSAAPAGPTGGKFALITLEGLFLEDIIFMINDKFVNRVYSGTELQSECKLLGVPFAPRLDINVDDIDVPRVLSCLEQFLGVSIAVHSQKLVADPHTNVFDGFFNLDDASVNLLRSDFSVMTTVELPLSLSSGVRAKMQDYVSLQQRIAAKLISTIDSTMVADVLHYQVSVARFILLHANDVNIAHRGYLQDEDFEDVRNVQQQISCPSTAYGNALAIAFDGVMALRMAHFLSQTDLQACLRRLMKFTDATRTLYDSAVGTAFVLADKIHIICQVCEKFTAAGLVAALETALSDLSSLTVDPHVYRLDASGGSPGGPSAQVRQRKSQRHAEIKTVQSAHLQLLPLSLLVRHVMLPDTKRTQGESLAAAVRFCSKRRDLIVEVYGEKSIEAGIACNDIAAICSNNKFDFDKAEEEFERAVFILTEVQPDGASLQITKNNLAFLCFRKAERLRKQINFDSAQKGPQARAAIHNAVNMQLSKAKMLLTEVLEHEQKLPVLDFAAALNNLASIKLFESKFDEAKALFTRTLEVTARLGGGDGAAPVSSGAAGDEMPKNELPCRVHALRNLKVLARRQYLSAVMRVQAAVRRFVTRIRERKNFAMLRAIKPIQRLGRGLLTRLFLAKHYRYSAFHSWLRQPKAFTKKLDPTFLQMPLEARVMAWQAKLSKAARMLQRVGRGAVQRRSVGRLVCFLKAHFATRRPLIHYEMARRRSSLISAQILRWKLLYGCEQIAELSQIHQEALRREVALIRLEVFGEESRASRRILLSMETSHRSAFERDTLAVLSFASREFHTNQVEFEWRHSRHVFALDSVKDLEKSVRAEVATFEALCRHVSIGFFAEQLQLFLLEATLRQRIAVEGFTKFASPRVVETLQRVARSYLIRKNCGRLTFIAERESDVRERIVYEEVVSLNRASMLRRVQSLHVMEGEEAARSKLVRHAMMVFRRQNGMAVGAAYHHPLPLEYDEIGERVALERCEADTFTRSCLYPESISRAVLESKSQYLRLLGGEAVSRKAITEACRAHWMELSTAQYAKETVNLMKRYTEFALAVLVTTERQNRLSVAFEEASGFVLQLHEPWSRCCIEFSEHAMHLKLCQAEAQSISVARLGTELRERFQVQRSSLDLQESNGRRNVVEPLENVAWMYILVDWNNGVAREFHRRCEAYGARLFNEWFAFEFAPGALAVIREQELEQARLEEANLRQWSRRDRDVCLSMQELRSTTTCQRQETQFWMERWSLEQSAHSLRLRQAAEAEREMVRSVGFPVQALHLEALQVCSRRACATELLSQHASMIVNAIERHVHPIVVASAERDGFDALQRLALEDLERVARHQFRSGAVEFQFYRCLVEPLREEMRQRTRIVSEQALSLSSLYLLERHASVIAGQLMPLIHGILEKRYRELHTARFSRARRESLAVLQRAGRGYLRRRRVGAFHFAEVVRPLILAQRVGRGYLTRASRSESCHTAVDTLRAASQRRRVVDVESVGRSDILCEYEHSVMALQKALRSFTGTSFLRARSNSQTSTLPAAEIRGAQTTPRTRRGSFGRHATNDASLAATEPRGGRCDPSALDMAEAPEALGGPPTSARLTPPAPRFAATARSSSARETPAKRAAPPATARPGSKDPHAGSAARERLFAMPAWQSSSLYTAARIAPNHPQGDAASLHHHHPIALTSSSAVVGLSDSNASSYVANPPTARRTSSTSSPLLPEHSDSASRYGFTHHQNSVPLPLPPDEMPSNLSGRSPRRQGAAESMSNFINPPSDESPRVAEDRQPSSEGVGMKSQQKTSPVSPVAPSSTTAGRRPHSSRSPRINNSTGATRVAQAAAVYGGTNTLPRKKK